ncbi:MAG: hypothetical protein J6K26_09360 [Lachnospiraceae bacterium]|nr:hypothetical protein [Lachnospiraceae bacterium]
MISKQSGRIIYRGKDHKDVFFNGKYYPVMAAKNDYGCNGVIWRKLFRDKYYMTRSAQWWSSGYMSVSSLGIYYNDLDIYREQYRFLEGFTTVIGAKFLALVETAYKSPYGYTVSHEFIYLTKDGKYYKKFDLEHVICAGPFFVSDGFVYVYDDGTNFSGGTSYFYHVVVDDDMNKKEESLLFSIEDGYSNFHKGSMIRCPHIGSDPNVMLYYSNNLYAISMEGSCVQTDISCQSMYTSWMSYQNGRFILPMYASGNSGYVSYLGESTNGVNWAKHTFPDTGMKSGNIAVLWDGSEYICYADSYYDSDHYCLKIYAGSSLSALSLISSLQGDGFQIALVSGDKAASENVTLVFDSKYTESYYVKYAGIYRISANIILRMLAETVCFRNYKRCIPNEILIGSTTLNKYQTYSYYWTIYFDNLYLQPSDKNFMCSNYSPSSGTIQKEWGVDIAEYYATGGK